MIDTCERIDDIDYIDSLERSASETNVLHHDTRYIHTYTQAGHSQRLSQVELTQ
jgi:hypothetical protein